MYLQNPTKKRQSFTKELIMKFRFSALIFHLLPIVPFALGYNYGGIAALLLVIIAYIKVQKLKTIAEEEERKFGKVHDSIDSARGFWFSLTFLR